MQFFGAILFYGARSELCAERPRAVSEAERPRDRIFLGEDWDMPAWFYMLRLRSTSLYSGSTRFLEKRIVDHFAGRGCRTTRVDPPIALAYTEEYPTYKEAFCREQQVKHWSRAKKEALIRGDVYELKRLAQRRKRITTPK
jgi:putative endonuclease